MSLSALQSVIAADPANAARSDADVLAWLEADVDVVGAVSHGQLIAWAGMNDLFAAMREASAGAAGQARGLADAALAVIDRGEGLDMSDPNAQALVSALVAVGLVSAPQHAELLTTATKSVPRWQSEGLQRPTVQQIARVR